MKPPAKAKSRQSKRQATAPVEKLPESPIVARGQPTAPFVPRSGAIWKAKHVCEFLAISRDTLDRWIKAGKVPQPSWNGRLRIWASDAIQDLARQMLSVQTRQAA
jgi:predicted DNA-binding transcriptional regulator AlpA